MKVHFFWVTMSLLLPVQAVSAAALEQSGQSMHIFFSPIIMPKSPWCI